MARRAAVEVESDRGSDSYDHEWRLHYNGHSRAGQQSVGKMWLVTWYIGIVYSVPHPCNVSCAICVKHQNLTKAAFILEHVITQEKTGIIMNIITYKIICFPEIRIMHE